MFKKIAVMLSMALAATQANADGVDLRLADETAEILFLTESSTFGYGGADVGIGVFFNEADDYMISASAIVSGNSANNNNQWQFGVGGKLVYVSLDDEPLRNSQEEEVGALAIGGQVRYIIPAATPVAFLAEGFIAPSVTSFSDADQYLEYRLAVELEVTPSARAYLGFRTIEIDLDPAPSGIEIDDEVHIGIKVEF